ncbi:hypothetical protein F4780DRAFT_461043 [Xylariomycetidae sp. FL0641]|nr:hypothetical protein F4780DRAFT_461043 [Xylariomycetidae sp. FL0641]
MHTTTTALLAALSIAQASAKIPFVSNADVIPISEQHIPISSRQSQACFVIGSEELPEETADVADALASTVTCSDSDTTLEGVPDVTSGAMTFSSIDFSQSGSSPLQFALDTFAAGTPLAQSNLQAFQDALNVYQATEAGIRSVGGDLTIKIPKFFLEMQVSRIQTAQGNPPSEAGLQVDHLRDKVLSNAASEDQSLLDEVTALASQLS